MHRELSLVLFVCILGGCHECTTIKCSSGLVLEIYDVPGQPLRPGIWSISIAIDESDPLISSCAVEEDSSRVSCSPNDARVQATAQDSLDKADLFKTGFGTGEGGKLPGIVDLRVLVDDQVVLEETHEPEYELREPHCDSSCRGASVIVHVQE